MHFEILSVSPTHEFVHHLHESLFDKISIKNVGNQTILHPMKIMWSGEALIGEWADYRTDWITYSKLETSPSGTNRIIGVVFMNHLPASGAKTGKIVIEKGLAEDGQEVIYMTFTEWTQNHTEKFIVIDPENKLKLSPQNLIDLVLRSTNGDVRGYTIIDKDKSINLEPDSGKADECSTCWGAADIADSKWEAGQEQASRYGRNYYTAENLYSLDPDRPFVLNRETGYCDLNCKEWTMFNGSVNPSSQSCMTKNCKSYDDSNKCLECFVESEILDLPNWRLNNVYSQNAVKNRNPQQPFKLNDLVNACDLQCTDDHWSNATSKRYYVQKPRSQKCIYKNCRDWDPYAATGPNQDPAKICTACWSEHDIADYQNWDAKDRYSLAV
jgi:hypothetical protein